MHKTSIHHVKPVSIYGSDHESNRMKMKHKDHEMTHKILNINYNLVRKMRQRVNDVLIRTPRKMDIIHKVQERYFDNMDKLPDNIIHTHADSFTQQIIYRDYQIKSIVGLLDGDDTYSIDEGRKSPPSKKVSRQEILDESIQKMHYLFNIESERARKHIEYIKEVYNMPRKPLQTEDESLEIESV